MGDGVSIQPMLTVRGGARAVAFYEAAFGATTAYRVEDPDGNVVARLSIRGAEFWVNDGSPCPETLGGTTFRTILVVPDVDEAYGRAVAAGARGTGVHEAHGWRTGRLVDPFGHEWGGCQTLVRLTDDLTSRRTIFLKGWLFLVLGLFAGGSLLALHPGWDVAGLLAVAAWAFCRWYYFAFYVVERYVDPSFRFAGLGSFARYLWRSRARHRRETP